MAENELAPLASWAVEVFLTPDLIEPLRSLLTLYQDKQGCFALIFIHQIARFGKAIHLDEVPAEKILFDLSQFLQKELRIQFFLLPDLSLVAVSSPFSGLVYKVMPTHAGANGEVEVLPPKDEVQEYELQTTNNALAAIFLELLNQKKP
jgi:hypothetical protein